MHARWWGPAAALWALGYVLLYVAVIRHQGGDVAWWYVVLVWLASALAAAAAVVRSQQVVLVVAAVLYGAAAALALLTIGVLLLPSAVACLLALRPARASA